MRQSYAFLPDTVEVFKLGKQTDIILRKAIKKEKDDDENDVYTCEERQVRYPGIITAATVTENFDYYWEYCKDPEPVPTTEERLEAMEAALLELTEVICNG